MSNNNLWSSYKGKTVLITGASSGIGLSLTKQLALKGAELILVARSQEVLEQTAQNIRDKGGKAHVIAEDLSQSGSAEKVYEQVNELGLSIDLLINNAGYGRWGDFDEFEFSDYEQMIQLNITTLTELCKLFMRDMLARRQGGVINTSSTGGLGPVPYSAVYAATKAYVLNFSEALTYEYQAKGIQVMALCPGGTESKFAEVASEKSAETRANALKRIADPKANYLSSDAVAKECLEAFSAGKLYHITGKSNRRMYAIAKHLSRQTVLKLTGNLFKKVVKGE